MKIKQDALCFQPGYGLRRKLRIVLKCSGSPGNVLAPD